MTERCKLCRELGTPWSFHEATGGNICESCSWKISGPAIWRDAFAPMFDEFTIMETGDGWIDLVWKACQLMQAASRTVKVLQVKEKFGTLRLYIFDADNPDTWKIAHQAELASAHICEFCGNKRAKLRNGSWLKTLCKKCSDKRDAETLEYEATIELKPFVTSWNNITTEEILSPKVKIEPASMNITSENLGSYTPYNVLTKCIHGTPLNIVCLECINLGISSSWVKDWHIYNSMISEGIEIGTNSD